MKSNIAKIITKGIFIGAGIELLIKLGIYILIDISNKPAYNEPRMDCFGGLQYGILIGITILAVLMSLPSYLNLYPRVRNTKWLSFLVHFVLHIVYFVCCLPLLWERYSSGGLFLIFTPCLYWIVWIVVYWKMRKKIKPANI